MLFGYFKFNSLGDNTFSSIAGAISIRLALFVVVLLCRNFKSLKQGEKIPIYYWLAIFILPIFSLYVMFLLFNLNWVNNTTLAIACSAILGINFSVFYLYDAIIKTQSEKLQKDLLVEQNKSYEKQFELIEESVMNAEMIKHDFKHHLSVINGMLNTNQSPECSAYIQELLQTKSTYNSFINSGNIVIDSILNFKLKSIAKNNITVNSDITIPCDFQISSTDMTIILGNLLDNALKAVLKLETARNIDIILKETKGRFIIKIANTFNCECIFKDGKIVSSKGQSGSHGLWLESVKYTLEKYNGELDIDIIGNIFSATVLFYL